MMKDEDIYKKILTYYDLSDKIMVEIANNNFISIKTKEELLANAEKLDLQAYISAKNDNILNAETQYLGKNVLLTGYVERISSEEITLVCYYGQYKTMKASLKMSEEEIRKLTTDQFIDVVGTISQVDGTTIIENAYFVNDTYTVSGTLVFGYFSTGSGTPGSLESSACFGEEKYFSFKLMETDDGFDYYLYDLCEINHTPGKRISTIDLAEQSLSSGEKITISFRMKHGFYGRQPYDIISLVKN